MTVFGIMLAARKHLSNLYVSICLLSPLTYLEISLVAGVCLCGVPVLV